MVRDMRQKIVSYRTIAEETANQHLPIHVTNVLLNPTYEELVTFSVKPRSHCPYGYINLTCYEMLLYPHQEERRKQLLNKKQTSGDNLKER